MDYDIKIIGGTIIDGTGSPGMMGEVGIQDGRIAALGTVNGSAEKTIDAGGKVVCPGFVDIHTHYDAQIFWDRMLTISPWHGVTTVVMGNCGFGVAPTHPEHRERIMLTLEKVEGMSVDALRAGLGDEWPFETFPEYLDALDRSGAAINVGVLIGHTPVRQYVMGDEATERAATDDEIARMRVIVKEALEAGAVGFATSKSPTHVGYKGLPVPSRMAELHEIRALADTLRETGHGVMQATIGSGLFFSQFATIAKDIQRNISWTALLAGLLGPGSHRSMLERAAKQQDDGLPIYPQVSCRPLMFEFNMKEPFLFENMAFFKPISAADVDGKMKIYSDPDFRQQFRDGMEKGIFSGRWNRTVIASAPTEPDLEERVVTDVANEKGVDPADLVLDLSLASNLKARFRMAAMNDDENEVEELLRHPAVILGLSDAGAHASQLCDACFSTYLLGHWVREKEVLTLERAIHMLTAGAADVFELADRGRLTVGMPADVVIFDPDTVGAGPLRRVYDFPAGADRLISEATGIDAVLVNGTLIRQHNEDMVDPLGPLPGTILRPGRAAA